jgi:hypothetical protein
MAFAMGTATLKIRVYVMFALAMGVSLPAAAQTGAVAQTRPGTATVAVDAPMFLLPDAARTPLTTIPAGTVVRVLGREGDWYQIIFRDQFLGDRTGYVQATSIRLDNPVLPRTPAITLPAPGAPQRSAARPPAPTPPQHPLAPWAERGDYHVYALYQSTSNAFTATTTLTRNVEQGSVTTSYGGSHSLGLDLGARARVARHVAVGGSVTWLSQKTSGDVSATVPHPFFFNALRQVSGVGTDLPREEIAAHGEVSALVPIGRVLQAAVFAGPSYFHLQQGLVLDVAVNETYPYDTATFASATTTDVSKSAFGFNAGVDVSARIAGHVGVGVTARYSRATVKLPASDTEDVAVRGGGLQIGGGIRFGF